MGGEPEETEPQHNARPYITNARGLPMLKCPDAESHPVYPEGRGDTQGWLPWGKVTLLVSLTRANRQDL